ncbi:MAG: hypothetical protein ABIU63_15425 [Chitinophagaceae bacterium]
MKTTEQENQGMGLQPPKSVTTQCTVTLQWMHVQLTWLNVTGVTD